MGESYLTVNPGRIQDALLERQWTMTDLSRQANVSYSGIRALLKGRRTKAHRITVAKMASALKVSLAELYVMPSA